MATKGELFELRVARLLAAEGAFVRRRVNLEPGRGGQVTDLDVLAFFFDETLRVWLVAGECKTAVKGGPSSKDRLLWLAGVNQLVGADGGFLATMRNARDDDRDVARSLRLGIVEPRALERRERIAAPTLLAAHSEAALEVETQVEAAVGKDDELKRVFQFVRSELWLSPPVAALKRALGAMRIIGGRWSPALAEREQLVLRWLFGELVCGFVVTVTRLAGESYQTPEDVFARQLNEQLAEGLAPYDAMREIAKQVDRLLVGILRDAGLDDSRVVSAIGALAPRPPGYAEPLFELVQRLAAEPRLARELPTLTESYLAGAHGDEAESARLLRLVAAFVERQGRVPAELVAPLRWRPVGLSASPTGSTPARGDEKTAEPPVEREVAGDEQTAEASGKPDAAEASDEREAAGDEQTAEPSGKAAEAPGGEQATKTSGNQEAAQAPPEMPSLFREPVQ